MGHKDLREFVLRLEEKGELQRIKTEVDWNLELSAIMRRVFEVKGPACLFERVKDSKFPVLSGAFFGYKKYGLAVEASPNVRVILQKVLGATQKRIAPMMVTEGPCKENIDTGNRINLEKFPVPKWHHLDGGRYIGTLGVVITKDPETGIRNMGVYRQQMIDNNKLGMIGTQHLGIHLQKYRAQNRAMPVATAIGVPPAVLAAACVQVPYGEDELGIAGGIAGEPIPLVKCETIDLEVPANAEIVLEGEIPVDVNLWKEEGPYGEFTGYASDLKSVKRPTVYLSAVTYREHPIYQGCSPGIPPNEETIFREIGHSVGAWHKLLKSGIPGIKEVYTTEMGCAQFMLIVSMERQYYLGNARQVIDTIFGTIFTAKWVIVVDDDIDIYDRGQVEWALAVRVQPHRDIVITDNRCTGSMLDPSTHPEMRKYLNVQSSKIGIDATTKYKGYDFAPVVRSAEEQKRLVERRWKEYGFR
jgi:UbiD family decarboxylase